MHHTHPTTDSPASASSSTLVISDSPSHLGKLDDVIPPPPNAINIIPHTHTPSLPIHIPNTAPKERPFPPQLSLITQTSTSPNLSRMSSRGFVEPHKNHLPRRNKPRASVSATATPELPQTAPLSQSHSHPHHPISGTIPSVIAGVQATSALLIGGDTPVTNTLSPALAESGSPPPHPVPATAPLPRRVANAEVGVGLGLALHSDTDLEIGDGPGYSSFSVLGAGNGDGNELQAELDLAMKKLNANEGDEPTPQTPQPPPSSTIPTSDQPVFSTPQPQSAPPVNQFPTPSVLALSQHVHNWTPPPIGLDRRTPRAKGAVGPGWSSVPRRSGGVRNREGSPLRNESPLRDMTGRAQSPLRNESFVGERRTGAIDRAKSQLRDRRMSVTKKVEEGEGVVLRGREGAGVKRDGKGGRDESPLRRGRSVFARGRDEGSGVADVDVEMSGSNVEVLDGQPLRPESLLDVDGEVDTGVEDMIEGSSSLRSEVANVEDAPCAFQELRVRCEKGEVGVWLGLLPASTSSADDDGLEISLRVRELEDEGKKTEVEGQDDTPKDEDTPARLRTRSQSLKSSSKIRWIVKDEKRISIPPPAPSSYIPLSSPNQHDEVKPSISDSYPVGVPCLSTKAVKEAVMVLNGWWESTLDKSDCILARSRRLEVLVPRERKEDGICVVLCFLLGVLSGWGVVEDLGMDDAEKPEQGHVGRNAEEEKEGLKRLAAISSNAIPNTSVGDDSVVVLPSNVDASCLPSHINSADTKTSSALPSPEITPNLLPPEPIAQPARNLLFAIVDGSGEVEISSANRSVPGVGDVDPVNLRDDNDGGIGTFNVEKDGGVASLSVDEDDDRGHLDADDDRARLDVEDDRGRLDAGGDDDVLVIPAPVELTDLPPLSSVRVHRRSMRGHGHGQAGGIHSTGLERELSAIRPTPPLSVIRPTPPLSLMQPSPPLGPVDSMTVVLQIPPSPVPVTRESQFDPIPITLRLQSQPVLPPNGCTPEPPIVRNSYITPAALPLPPLAARTKRMDTPLHREWMGVLSADGMDAVEEIWKGINEEIRKGIRNNEERARMVQGLGSV